LRKISHYELEKLLGEGGMGAVWLARDIVLDRPVAIKLLNTNTLGDPEFLDRFKREAKLAAQLNHPNIATVYEFGEDEGESFIAMEFVEGETLSQVVNKGPLDYREVRRLGGQIARALAAAHDRGIVHRDIKCPNLMLTTDGTLKVMDFGVSRRMGDTQVTMAGALVGTAHIMAPEIINGLGAGPEADLFSLGCVLYELTAATPAFHGDDAMGILYRIANNEPTPLTEHRPDVPPDILGVVEGLLIKEPAERFGPAQAVVDALAEDLGTSGGSQVFVPGDLDATIDPGTGVRFTPPPGMGPGGAAAAMTSGGDTAVAPPMETGAPSPSVFRRWLPWIGGLASVSAILVLAVLMLGRGGENLAAGDDGAADPATPELSEERRSAMALNDSAMALPPEQIEQAKSLLMQAVVTDPDYVMPWHNLGEVYRVNGDLANALEAREQGLEKHPDDPILLMGKADILEARGDTLGAIASYEAALANLTDATPADFRAPIMNNLGFLYVNRGRHIDALGVLSRAVNEFPSVAAVWKNLGLAQLGMGSPAQAQLSFEKALGLDPSYPAALEGHARALEAQAN